MYLFIVKFTFSYKIHCWILSFLNWLFLSIESFRLKLNVWFKLDFWIESLLKCHYYYLNLIWRCYDDDIQHHHFERNEWSVIVKRSHNNLISSSLNWSNSREFLNVLIRADNIKIASIFHCQLIPFPLKSTLFWLFQSFQMKLRSSESLLIFSLF